MRNTFDPDALALLASSGDPMLEYGPSARESCPAFLAGGGEMAERMRALDWSATPLGPVAAWPSSLRTAAGVMLNSRHPMFLAWGPELTFLYNDGYAPILGARHPQALGRPFEEIWSEIWSDLRPLVDRALTGEASWREDMHLVMERHGAPEDTWFSFSYSPVRDEAGAVRGMFCACTETTDKVLTERRLTFLLELGDRLRDTEGAEALKRAAAHMLAEALDLGRVGFVDIETEDGETWARIADDWVDRGMGPIAGRLRLADFGPAADLRSGRTARIDDVASDPRTGDYRQAYAAFGIGAALAVPLFRNGRLTALISGHAAGPRRWTDFDVSLLRDVAERTWPAVERARSEARYRELADAMPQLVWTADPDGRVDYYNRRREEYRGFEPTPDGHYTWAPALHEDDRARTIEAWGRALATGEPYESEHRLQRGNGDYAWHVSRGVAARDGAGRIVKWYGTATDIEFVKRMEQARELLIREVDHRAKNVLAVAQSIVKLTRAEDMARYVAAVNGRIGALARAHTLLAREGWSGGGLREVMEDELRALAKPGQYVLNGPDLTLDPAAVQPLGMIVHELATNAAKYGALSRTGGCVRLAWTRTAGGGVTLAWTETGGPSVAAPGRRGFGSTLLHELAARQLGGRLETDWRPEGLVARLELPAALLRRGAVEDRDAASMRAPASPRDRARRGVVLLVEDNALIGLDAHEVLTRAGLEVIGPVPSVATALEVIAHTRLDAAFLDVDLHGRTSFEIADALAARGVPFTFATGYGRIDADSGHLGRAVLRKPVGDEELLVAYDAMVGEAG